MHPDVIEGSTIVMTHPRSGSSMLMQTLRLLGVPVHGDARRPDLPEAANPGGYFEDRRLVKRGLDGLSKAGPPIDLRGKAVKFGVRGLVRPDRLRQWEVIAASDARLLLPLRDPAESILSRTVFMEIPADPRQQFVQLTELIFRRRFELVTLARRILAHRAALAERLHVIPYDLAHRDPAGYVALVAHLSGRAGASTSAAIANIRPDLYRFDSRALPVTPVEWVRKAGLYRLYDLLRNTPPDWEAVAEWGSENGVLAPETPERLEPTQPAG